MAVTFIEYSSSPGITSTSCVIARPTNLTVGDLMVAHCVWGLAVTIYPPDSSWTQIQQAPSQSGNNYQGAIFYKVATLSDTISTSFTFTSNGSYANRGAISTFSGQDLEIPIGDSCSRNRTSNDIETGAVFPVPIIGYYPNDCMIAFFGQGRTRNSISGWTLSEDDPGLTERYDINTPYTATLGMACAVRHSNTSFSGSAIIDDPNAVSNVGMLIAIQPRDTTDQSSSSSSSSSSLSSSSSSSSSAYYGSYYVCGDLSPDAEGEYTYAGFGKPHPESPIWEMLPIPDFNYWQLNDTYYLAVLIIGECFPIIFDFDEEDFICHGWSGTAGSCSLIGAYDPAGACPTYGVADVSLTPCEDHSSSSSSSTEVRSSSSSSTEIRSSSSSSSSSTEIRSSSSSSYHQSLIVQTSKYESPWPADGFIQFNLDNTPQEGNILLAFTLAHQSVTRNVTPPDASWTNIDTIKYGGYIGMDVWLHEVAFGDGTSYTFNISGLPLEFCSGILYEATNIDTENPIDQHGIVANAAPTVISSPIVTPSVLNTLAISACCTCAGSVPPPENNPAINPEWTLGPTAVPQWESTFGSAESYDDKAVAIVLLRTKENSSSSSIDSSSSSSSGDKFSPLQIPGLMAWWDSSSITGKNDGDPISVWNDSSGNGNTITTYAAATDGTYKTNVLNGKPIVRFLNTTMSCANPDSQMTNIRSVFFVVNHRTGNQDWAYIAGGDSGLNSVTYHGGSGTDLISTNYCDGNLANGKGYVNGVLTAIGSMQKSTSYTIYTFITVGNINTSGLSYYTRGASREWNGDYAEAIFYDSPLSDIDRVKVETYLSSKYAIPT